MTYSGVSGACSGATRDGTLESSLLAGERFLYIEGDLNAARERFDDAYREAADRQDGQAMARAALGLGGLWVYEHRMAADAAMVRLRQRPLALLDPASPLALRLRIRLTAEEDHRAGTHSKIMSLVAEARRAGDPVAAAEALSLAHHCVMGPEHGGIRLELAQELIGEASRTGRRSDLLMGLLWHAIDLFLDGDPHAERSLEELRALLVPGDHLTIGYAFSAIEVMLRIRSGRFEEAEAFALSCAERGKVAGDATVEGTYAAQLGTVRWYQGRIAELVPMLSELVRSPLISVLDNASNAALAVAAATAGDRRLATGTLALLRRRVLSDAPRTSSWLMSMYGVVEVTNLLDDAATAAEAYELLRPFAQRPSMLGLAVTCMGSVHQCLGVASLTAGDLDRAEEHLHSAVHDNLALGHWPAAVLSRFRLGQVLSLRGGTRNEAAQRELAMARQEAAALGMGLPRAAGRSPWSRVNGSRRVAVVVCRRQGRQWCFEMGDRSALVDHCVGMNHLATLLAHPVTRSPPSIWRRERAPTRHGRRVAPTTPPSPSWTRRRGMSTDDGWRNRTRRSRNCSR